VYDRQHAIWTQPVYLCRLRPSRDLDHSRCRRADCVLLRVGWFVGSCAHRLLASLDSDPVLPCTRGSVSRASRRFNRLPAFSSCRDEDGACFGRVGWIYILSWAVMVSFGYHTSAIAQPYLTVDVELS